MVLGSGVQQDGVGEWGVYPWKVDYSPFYRMQALHLAVKLFLTCSEMHSRLLRFKV